MCINLTKKETISFNLTEFIDKIYDFNFDSLNDFEIYNFYHDLNDNDLDTVYIEYLKNKYNVDSDSVKHQLKRIMVDKFENTYIDDTITATKEGITNQIIKDLKNIYKVNHDLFRFEEITVKKISFKQNKITLNTTIDNFAQLLISVINDYGMFEYDSTIDFFSVNSAITDNDKIKVLFNHLQWLNEYENIYGTIYYIFKSFDITKLDYFGTFGNYNIESISEIDDYIKNYGIDY